MTFAHIEDTGEAINTILEIAREDQTAETGIVEQPDGQAWVYSAQDNGDDYDLAEANTQPIRAAQMIAEIEIGRIWPEGEGMLMILRPGVPSEALRVIREGLDEGTDEVWTVHNGDSEYRSVDDHTPRGAMMYHERDRHFIDGHEFTRPEAQENPKRYIRALIAADSTNGAYLLKDADRDFAEIMREEGFEKEGQYELSMYQGGGKTHPGEKRAELYEEGYRVIIEPDTTTAHNPFRSKFTAWIRPEREHAF